jgi:predicted dehydrogenase
MTEIRVGVVGLGFIGQTHVRAYESARQAGLPIRLTAVCDRNTSRLSGDVNTTGNIDQQVTERLFEPSDIQTYTEPDQFLVTDAVDLVSICTHTKSHVEFAIKALDAGKHVLVEKPISNSADEVRRLLNYVESDASQGKLCMPAMCMRFWPAWAWLKDAISSNRFGSVRSASFSRLGSTPGWADSYYKDESQSGGALLDLHIHDTDFIHHCFGVPDAVFSTGDTNHLTTFYRFTDSPVHVTAEGCWDRAPGSPYEMRFSVCFQNATAVFDLNAHQQLVVYSDSESQAIELTSSNGWDMQVRALAQAILAKETTPPVSIRDAYEVMQTIEAERHSLSSGQPVCLNR